MDEEKLFADLELEMQQMPMPCEIPGHMYSELHQGPGEWYITITCPRCEQPGSVTLACEKYKRYMPFLIVTTGDSVVKCSVCTELFLNREAVISYARRIV